MRDISATTWPSLVQPKPSKLSIFIYLFYSPTFPTFSSATFWSISFLSRLSSAILQMKEVARMPRFLKLIFWYFAQTCANIFARWRPWFLQNISAYMSSHDGLITLPPDYLFKLPQRNIQRILFTVKFKLSFSSKYMLK